MYSNLTTFLILGSVALAAEISNSENDSDVIDDLLKTFEEYVDYSISYAKGVINAAEKDVNQTASDVEKVTGTSLSGIRIRYQEKMDGLKARAKNASVDVDECFGQDETTLMHLLEVAADELKECVEGYDLTIFNDADDVIKKVTKYADEVTEIRKEIANCNNGTKCLNELAERISNDIVDIQIQTPLEVTDFVGLVFNLKPEIQKCGPDAIGKCEASGQKLLEKIIQCVSNKIGH